MKTAFFGLALAAITTMATPVMAQEDPVADQLEAKILEVIRNNPEVIVQSLEAYQISQAEAARAEAISQVNAVLADPSYPRLGNPDAVPSGVVFLDYNCPHCRTTHVEIDKWLGDNPEKSVVILDYPILGPGSVLAAKAALAAQADGDYAEALHALMAVEGRNEDTNLIRTLDGAGLDAEGIAARMDSDEIVDRLVANSNLAQSLGVTGTPGSVFNGVVRSGGFTAEALDAWTAEAQ